MSQVELFRAGLPVAPNRTATASGALIGEETTRPVMTTNSGPWTVYFGMKAIALDTLEVQVGLPGRTLWL